MGDNNHAGANGIVNYADGEGGQSESKDDEPIKRHDTEEDEAAAAVAAAAKEAEEEAERAARRQQRLRRNQAEAAKFVEGLNLLLPPHVRILGACKAKGKDLHAEMHCEMRRCAERC